VARDYLGSGHRVQLAADLITEVRDRRAALVKALKNEQEDWESLGGAMDRLDAGCELMLAARLLTEGKLDARRRRRVKAAGTGGGRRPRAR
jgi:hypothetical protein